jgi:catechol 2,3-dioxygenase-like lactoylglutathione lyase family enzyme
MIYTGIRVKDMDESIRFYTEVLGMRLVERKMAPQTHGEWATLKSPDSDQLLELNWYAHRSRFGTPYENGSEIDHLGFDVENLEEWVRELEAKGVTILVRPHEIGGWNEASLRILTGFGSNSFSANEACASWSVVRGPTGLECERAHISRAVSL